MEKESHVAVGEGKSSNQPTRSEGDRCNITRTRQGKARQGETKLGKTSTSPRQGKARGKGHGETKQGKTSTTQGKGQRARQRARQGETKLGKTSTNEENTKTRRDDNALCLALCLVYMKGSWGGGGGKKFKKTEREN